MTGATALALSTTVAGAAAARAASPAAATTMTGATVLSTTAAGAAAARAASPAAATTMTGATEDLARATAAVDTARVERAGDVCFPKLRLSLYRRSLYQRSQKNQDSSAGGDLDRADVQATTPGGPMTGTP